MGLIGSYLSSGIVSDTLHHNLVVEQRVQLGSDLRANNRAHVAQLITATGKDEGQLLASVAIGDAISGDRARVSARLEYTTEAGATTEGRFQGVNAVRGRAASRS